MNSVANDGPEARGLNAALVVLYWQIGQRIRTDILRYQRAEYGEEILPTLSAKLVPEFGQGFSSRVSLRQGRVSAAAGGWVEFRRG